MRLLRRGGARAASGRGALRRADHSDTVALAADAAEAGADAVAVIGPPYFPLDPPAQLAHFAAAARACAPLPFYVYEFARTSGYAVSLDVLARLREEAPNFAGMKVSDTPWDAFHPYVLDGLAVFVGPESLIHLGLEAGAVGAVSALAGAFPVRGRGRRPRPDRDRRRGLAELRAGVERFPRQAAMKRVVAWHGVPLRPDVRAPLRDLDTGGGPRARAWLESVAPVT